MIMLPTGATTVSDQPAATHTVNKIGLPRLVWAKVLARLLIPPSLVSDSIQSL